mmetsp:Transcript_45129/g.115455  ORF Transcript_45129/g.115455 Transcript_45129/m.115455 type:complete len:251 (-) Transcript_45129:281-1033(-)
MSPCVWTSSWMLAFSYRMHSSSLRSMSMMPVKLRLSTTVSYCFFSRSISFSAPLMIALSLSISAICSSTMSCFLRNVTEHLFRSARSWSRWPMVAEWSVRSLPSSLSFSTDSLRRISTSLPRILSFSFISAQLWLAAWMRLTNLLRWFLTSSYSCWKSVTRRAASLCAFLRSQPTISLVFTSSCASFMRLTFPLTPRATLSRLLCNSFITISRSCSSARHRATSASSSFSSSNETANISALSLPMASSLR